MICSAWDGGGDWIDDDEASLSDDSDRRVRRRRPFSCGGGGCGDSSGNSSRLARFGIRLGLGATGGGVFLMESRESCERKRRRVERSANSGLAILFSE